MSKPYIHKSRGAINANVYINKCLRSNLVQFIKEHYNNDNDIFWPGLAKVHYAEVRARYLKSQNIKLVPMGDNPPNVPQARPIANFYCTTSLEPGKLTFKNVFY